MAKKQNMATWKELNEIELERSSYLINLDELIFETLGETIVDESGRFIKPLYMGALEEINLVHDINSPIEFLQSNLDVAYIPPTRQYKCPTCKNAISITSTDFIQGIAMTSCDDCGRNAFAIEDVLYNR